MKKQIRISAKKLQEYIDSETVVRKTEGFGLEESPDSYLSKIDNSYINFVGNEKDFKVYLKRGIKQLQSRVGGKTTCLGFNEEEQKWYGWSHRAMFGFGVGSECKKGSCGYSAGNRNDFAEENLKWYGDTDMAETYKENATVKEHTEKGVLGVLVKYNYNNKVPNKSYRGKISSEFEPYPETWGKGEWTAKTLEEAKMMAEEFAEGVS